MLKSTSVLASIIVASLLFSGSVNANDKKVYSDQIVKILKEEKYLDIATDAALMVIPKEARQEFKERVEKIDRLACIVIAVRVGLIAFRVWIDPEVCGISSANPKAHDALREHGEHHCAVAF